MALKITFLCHIDDLICCDSILPYQTFHTTICNKYRKRISKNVDNFFTLQLRKSNQLEPTTVQGV